MTCFGVGVMIGVFSKPPMPTMTCTGAAYEAVEEEEEAVAQVSLKMAQVRCRRQGWFRVAGVGLGFGLGLQGLA
jgi:hypothetical protein